MGSDIKGLKPVDLSKFRGRGLDDDPRLCELPQATFDSASTVLIGIPQDEGVVRNGGRPGGAKGPKAIRRRFYGLTDSGLRTDLFCDLGNVSCKGTLEDVHARVRRIVTECVSAGKSVVVLGGGNDISWPDAAGLHRAVGEFGAVNIDAHFDVRPGAEPTSGTPYRQLIDDGILDGDRFHEVAWQRQAISRDHESWLREQGAHLVPLEEVHERGMADVMESILRATGVPMFVGFDMDAVRAADAPGVSAPSPIGLTAEEAVLVAAICGASPAVRVFEISEVCPEHDRDGVTARLAAIMVHRFLAARS